MSVRAERQKGVSDWAIDAFGPEEALSVPHRGLRMLEEADEGAQAAGVTLEMAHKMVDYVWSRPVGNLGQELGGIGVTVLALAQAAGYDADAEEVREVERVLSKPREHFTQRNKVKNEAGFRIA